MSKATIEIIDDLEQCKKWGYDEPVISISDKYSSHLLPSSRVSMHEVRRILNDVGRHRQYAMMDTPLHSHDAIVGIAGEDLDPGAALTFGEDGKLYNAKQEGEE